MLYVLIALACPVAISDVPCEPYRTAPMERGICETMVQTVPDTEIGGRRIVWVKCEEVE